MPFRSGDRINHYTLLAPLGEGGQGSVWKVVDPRDGGILRALKLVSVGETGPASFERAVREARILASLDHPALVRCHSFFEEPRDHIVGLLMDLVVGRSLADIIHTRGLSHAQSLSLIAQVANALAYLHASGVVHRDLKPANLVLTDGFWESPGRPGVVKLVDFGIAASGARAQVLTTPGTVIGTLPYLAPELVDPATWGGAEGPARDVFALGVMAYQLLMNRHPTGLGEGSAMIDFARAYKAAEVGVIPWPPPGLDGSWGAAVGACLALRPSDRPASGAEVLEVLRTGVSSRRASRPSVSGPTEPYTRPPSTGAPTVVARMTPSTAPVYGITEPMPAPPAGVRMLPEAPIRGSSSGGPPATSRAVWVALVVLAFAVGAAMMFILVQRAPAESERPSAPLPVMATVPTAPMLVTTPQEQKSFSPCRREGLGFEPKATRFDCPICVGTPRPLPRGTWQMRFSGVLPKPPIDDPKRKICAQVTGSPGVCVPYSMMPDYAGTAGRLQVTTEEIEGRRIYISIRLDKKIEAQGFIHRAESMPRFLETALCSGLKLYLDDPALTISVYLDER